jgi:hypothetical protein
MDIGVMTNIWTQKSIEIASQKDYLDQLHFVYPMSTNVNRELTAEQTNLIINLYERKKGFDLFITLLDLEIFPLKDSYVSYLRRDRSSIERNPETVSRIATMLLDLKIDSLLELLQRPKETNRQIGPLFRNWKNHNLPGQVIADAKDFMDFEGNAILDGSDYLLKETAHNYLGYNHDKGLDFVGKFNNKFIVGEAKFLTDFGGHQTAQFKDAISTISSAFERTRFTVIPIAILDGVLYIQNNNQLFKTTTETVFDKGFILSALLLSDYLESL